MSPIKQGTMLLVWINLLPKCLNPGSWGQALPSNMD